MESRTRSEVGGTGRSALDNSRRRPRSTKPAKHGVRGLPRAAEPREAHTDAARQHRRPGSKQAAVRRPFCSRPEDDVDQASGHVTVSPPHLQGGAGTRPTRKETPTPLKDPHRSTNRRNATGLGSALKTLEIRGKGRRQVPRALPSLTTGSVHSAVSLPRHPTGWPWWT